MINTTSQYFALLQEIPDDNCTADMLLIKHGTPLSEMFEDIKAEIELVTRFGNAYQPIEHGLLMWILDRHIGKEQE